MRTFTAEGPEVAHIIAALLAGLKVLTKNPDDQQVMDLLLERALSCLDATHEDERLKPTTVKYIERIRQQRGL